MDSVWKTILGLVVFIMLIFGGISIVAANNDAVAAENYLNEVATVISESNQNQTVIDNAIQEAEDNGYILEVNKNTASHTGSGYTELVLKYKYKIPFLQVSSEHEKRKVIR